MAIKSFDGIKTWGQTYSKTRHTWEPMSKTEPETADEAYGSLLIKYKRLYRDFKQLEDEFAEFKQSCCPYCRILLPKTGICPCGFDKNRYNKTVKEAKY